MKKGYIKKRNAVKNTTRSGNRRDDVLKHKVEFNKHALLSWLNKHIMLRESRANVPDFDDCGKNSYLQEREPVGISG